jgi:hypothetical protein
MPHGQVEGEDPPLRPAVQVLIEEIVGDWALQQSWKSELVSTTTRTRSSDYARNLMTRLAFAGLRREVAERVPHRLS